MSAFTTSFTGVRVVSKTAVAKKSVSTKAVASMENVKKVRASVARGDADRSIRGGDRAVAGVVRARAWTRRRDRASTCVRDGWEKIERRERRRARVETRRRARDIRGNSTTDLPAPRLSRRLPSSRRPRSRCPPRRSRPPSSSAVTTASSASSYVDATRRDDATRRRATTRIERCAGWGDTDVTPEGVIFES